MFINGILSADFNIFSKFSNLLYQNDQRGSKKHLKTDQKIKVIKT